MREAWTDERLDDLMHRMDSGFDRVEKELRTLRLETRTELRSEAGALRTEIKSEVGALRSEIKSEAGALRTEIKSEGGALRSEMNNRFDAMQRLIIQVGAGMIATLVVGFLGVAATLH